MSGEYYMAFSNLLSRIQTNSKIVNFSLPFEIIISFIDYLYPKDNKVIILGSNTGKYISGSPRTLYEYIKKNNDANYELYYYLPFQKSSDIFNQIKHILRFAPIFFRARFLVSSHPPTDFFPFISWSKKKVFINTWHGTPLKSILFADKGETKSDLRRVLRFNEKTSFFLVSSELDKRLMEQCFRIIPTKFIFSGQPRNDQLMTKQKQKKIPLIFHDIPIYDKIILYCPTYRRDNKTNFFPFKDINLKELNDYMEQNKIIILLRSHVFDNNTKDIYLSSRIINCGFEKFENVNSILNEVDVLITDYSILNLHLQIFQIRS